MLNFDSKEVIILCIAWLKIAGPIQLTRERELLYTKLDFWQVYNVCVGVCSNFQHGTPVHRVEGVLKVHLKHDFASPLFDVGADLLYLL